MTAAQAYLHGDLDGDGDNDFFDFRLFKADYIDGNGAAAFAALPEIGLSVPEPSAAILAALGMLALGVVRRRRTN
jgi:MYXO-CTERM domain-containing protein